MSNTAEVVIVRHHFEAPKSSGSGRIAGLALRRFRLLEYGGRGSQTNEELAALPDPWLLYPQSGEASPLIGSLPQTLVVLDGTWRQAKRMLKHLPTLWHLPRLTLPPKGTPPPRLRAAPSASARSTLEAIADALTLLEGPELGNPLHELHQRFVEHVLRVRGAKSRAELAYPQAERALLGAK